MIRRPWTPTAPSPRTAAGRAALPWAALLSVALLLAPLMAAPPLHAATGPWQENDQSRVRLVTPWETAPAEGTVTLGLEFETEPGWHVYWKNSGDAGYPPAIDLSATPAVGGAELLWPVPERYELPGDLVAFGYEKHVVYPLRVELAADPGSGPLRLVANLDYLVCEVDCIPYTYRLEVEQPLAADGAEPVPDPNVAPRLDAWVDRVPRPVEALTGVASDGELDLSDPDRPALRVRFQGLEAAEGAAAPELFLEAHGTFDAGRPELQEGGDGSLRFHVPLSFRARPDTLPADADFAWTLAGAVPVAAGGDGDAGQDGAVPVEARRSVPARTVAADVPPATPVPRPAPAALALWAFLGGLLLHLVPSVFPLSLGRLAEIGATAGNAGTGAARRGALLTAGAIAAGSLALVPLAAGARAAGRPSTWGAPLQEPVTVALLALAATLVTLNLWGFLRAPLQPAETGDGAGPGAAPLRAVLAGLAVVVLGLGWNLPALARSLGPALGAESGPGPALLATAALAAGLAVPFLAAAAVPSLTARLAPTGPGRRRLAEALAFVELGAVLWFLYLLSRQVSSEGLAFVQLALLGVALAAWWGHTAGRSLARGVAAALLVLLAAAAPWLASSYRLGGAGSDLGASGGDPAPGEIAQVAPLAAVPDHPGSVPGQGAAQGSPDGDAAPVAGTTPE